MKTYVPDLRVSTPLNFEEALRVKDENNSIVLLAGGTDIMVLIEAGKIDSKDFLNICNLTELRGIEIADDFVKIGALTTHSEIKNHNVLQDEFWLLCQAAELTGAIAIQNRGTLGGNIMNASPAADSPPALLVYEAELELVSMNGSRIISYIDFHEGYKKMKIKPNEILKSIRLSRNTANLKQYYRKVGARRAQAISKVVMAILAKMQDKAVGDIKIALGSVAPRPIRCYETEDFLIGKKLNKVVIDGAKKVLSAEIFPIDDIRSTKEYRSKVAGNLLEDCFKEYFL